MPQTLLGTIAEGGFPVSVQIDPPEINTDPERFGGILSRFENAGVKFIDINTKKGVALDTLLLAGICPAYNLNPIPHISPRDKAFPNMMNEILTAYQFYGLREVLIISGDPYHPEDEQFVGDFKNPDAVLEIRTIQAHCHLQNLCRDLKVGSAFDHNAKNIDRELRRLQLKVNYSGADFYMTQVAFTEAEVDKLISLIRSVTDKPIIIGVWPIMHLRTRQVILAGQVDGVVLSPELAKISEKYETDADIRAWGIDESLKLIAKIKDRPEVGGIYLASPRRKPEFILEVFRQI